MKTPNPVEQEEGHPQGRSRGTDVPFSSLAFWLGVALVVVVGLFLFFRYQREISPLFGGA